jgi:ribosomal protein S27AE
MKICRTCGEEKPLSDYYRHPQMGDGYLNICKHCTRARVRRHRNTNIDRIRKYDCERRKVLNPLPKLTDEDLRVRRNARALLRHYVNQGKIKVKPCERCGYGVGVHAHHEDYAKPLDVVWLCRRCHYDRHVEINEERRKSA